MTSSGTEPDAQTDSRLSWRHCYGWGIGTLGVAVLWQVTNVFLLNFMTDFVGIAAAVAGAIVFGAKIYDAITDPIVGWLSDRTKTRFGRRRPYVAVGGIMLGISSFLLFGFGHLGQSEHVVLYYLLFLLFYSTSVTIFNVPYLAMPAEMTGNRKDISRLMSVRVAATGVSIIISSFVPLVVDAFGGGNEGYRVMGAVIGLIIIFFSVKSILMTLDAPTVFKPVHSAKIGFVGALRTIGSNSPFIALLATKFFWLTALSFASITPFFFTNVIELTSQQLTIYFLIFAVSLTVAPSVFGPLTSAIGMVRMFQICLLTSGAVYLSWLLVGAAEPAWTVYLRAVFLGFFAGGALLAGQAMLPDTMHYDKQRTGLNREGIFSGIYTTVEKLSSAVGIALAGVYLQSQGYESSSAAETVVQNAKAVQGIKFSMAVFPAIAALLAAISIHFFRIPEDTQTPATS